MLDHGRDIARRQPGRAREDGADLRSVGVRPLEVERERGGARERESLRRVRRLEAHLQREPPQRRLVEPLEEVGRADEPAVKALDLHEELVDLGHLPRALRVAARREERVGLIEDQHGAERLGLCERRGEVLLVLADVLRQELRRGAGDDGQLIAARDLLGERGLARARRPVEQHTAARAARDRTDQRVRGRVRADPAEVVGERALRARARLVRGALPLTAHQVREVPLDERGVRVTDGDERLRRARDGVDGDPAGRGALEPLRRDLVRAADRALERALAHRGRHRRQLHDDVRARGLGRHGEGALVVFIVRLIDDEDERHIRAHVGVGLLDRLGARTPPPREIGALKHRAHPASGRLDEQDHAALARDGHHREAREIVGAQRIFAGAQPPRHRP